MSEQWTPTTDQVRSFYAHDSEDEYHDPIGYPSHVRSAEQAFDRWLAQVQREANVQALREAARDFEVSTINIQIFGNSLEAELVRVDNAARARFVESLRARADRIV